MKNILRFLAIALLSSSALMAQQTSIGGTVTDSSGAVIAGANIKAARVDGGAGYSVQSNGEGLYQLPSIVASDYNVAVEAPGFQRSEQKATVLLGQRVLIDFKLRPASANTTIDVVSSAATINTVVSDVSGNVDPEQTKQLPLNGNNWQQLAAIVPGIRENSIGNVPVYKNSWGTYQIYLDGQQVTQSNEFSWKGEPQFSREAIGEFQITTNRFDATHGRSSFIFINAQTKSGGNTTHGSIYGFFRNSSVGSAATPVSNKVLDFSDQLYGGTISGPIRKDKLFYFASYETDRTPSTTVSLPYGFTPISRQAVNNIWKYLTRFDYIHDSRNNFSLRLTAHKNDLPYYSVTQHWKDNSYNAQLNYNHVFTPNLISDLKIGVTRNFYGQQNYYTAVQLQFPSVTLGTDIYAPTAQNQENQSIREDLYWQKGKHSIRLGSELILVNEHGEYSNAQNGQAVLNTNVGSGVLAAYTWSQIFPNYFDPSTWQLALLNPAVVSYRKNYGDDHFSVPRKTLGLWIQDDWRVTKRLTFNLGLRYDNDFQLFRVTANYPSSWGLTKPTHGDNNNIAPRLGFALDPTGSGKSSIRGGIGLYYSDMMATFVKKANMLNGISNPIPSITKTGATPINLLDPFNGATVSDFIANPAKYQQAIFTMDPNIVTPWTVQATIGGQREIKGAVISLDYVHDRSHNQLIAQESNVYYDAASNINLSPAQAIAVYGGTYGRPNANFGSILTFKTPTNVGTIYDALLLNVEKLRWKSFTGSIAYTFARERSNNVFNNPYKLSGSWGLAANDQRHTINSTLIYQYKWGLRSAFLLHYGSGAHYDVTAGTQPTGMTQSDPASLTNRYFCGAEAVAAKKNSVCTAVTKTYNDPAHNHYDPTTGLNYTDKDQLTGSPIVRLDANIVKETKFNDRYRLAVQVDAFNLTNHANYGSYTTSITSTSFGRPLTSTDTAYWPRSFQFSARLGF